TRRSSRLVLPGRRRGARVGRPPRIQGSSRWRRRRGRTGAPAWHGGPAGVRRSGSSSVDLLGAWGSGNGRTESGPCVELILQDDRRGFTVDTRPIGIALRLA